MLGKFIALNKQGVKFKFELKEDGTILYNGKKADIKIEEDEDGFTYVIYRNYKYPVEVSEKSQNKYVILINNVSYDFSVETPISFRRKKFLAKKHKDVVVAQLVAPMPGKIVEILIEDGAEVKVGDAMLILEAMKMQNEIISQFSGIIKKVHVRPGDLVMKDDVLVEFEK